MGTVYYNPVQPYMPPPPPHLGHQPGPVPVAGDYTLEIPDGVQNIEYITLDISKKTRARFAPITIRQGDRKGTALIVTVVDTTNGEIRDVDIEMADVKIEMILPDKETVYVSDIAEEVVGNRALIVIDESKAAVYAGTAQANVVIEQDDTRISTQPFRVKVVGTVKPGDAPVEPQPQPGGTTDYADLENKPSINGVELVGDKATADLAISYNDLTDKPRINGQELTNDSETGEITISYNDLTDKPKINGQELTNDSETGNVVISYNDLVDKPTINGQELGSGDFQLDVSDLEIDPASLNISYNDLADKPKINGVELGSGDSEQGIVISYNDLADKPRINGQELTNDSETGEIVISYNDLTDKPTINGIELGSGDTGITAADLHITYDDIEGDKPSTSYNDLTDKPTINGKTVEGALTTDDVVDTDAIASQVAANVDTDTIAQKLIDSGALTDEIVQTASSEAILNIVANNSEPVDDHSLDRD